MAPLASERPSGTAPAVPDERPWCWERFLTEMAPRLLAVLGSFRVPPSEREDLIQRALLAMLLKEATIQNRERWLCGALRNECRMYWRQRLNRPEEIELSDSLAPTLTTDREGAYAARVDIDRAVGNLAGRHQMLIRMRYGKGLSPSQVARRLRYSTTSLKKINSRCLRKLRKDLADYQVGSS